MVLFSFLPSCSCDGVTLVKASPCHDGETRKCSVPPCSGEGVSICEEGQWGPCIGYQIPKAEICNGIDDDCDGEVDNNPAGVGEGCGSDEGACFHGRWRCKEGELICSGGIKPSPETCNGVDDDCDGMTDEDIEEKLCYSLGMDDPTRGVGICHSGISRCVAGKSVCMFEQLPQPPDCSNGLDNDCDGQKDPSDGIKPVDLVILVDRSGSMKGILGGIVRGLSDFASKAVTSGLDVRVALISVPVSAGWDCGVDTKFVNPQLAANILSTFKANKGGAEPTLGCLYGVSHDFDPFRLNWRPGAKKVAILFTNEDCQDPWCTRSCAAASKYSWCDEAGFPDDHLLTAEEVGASLENAGIVVHMFLDDPTYYLPISLHTGGLVYSIRMTNLGDEVLKLLNQISCNY